MINVMIQFALPMLAAILAFMYWRRASIGLEAHLKHVAIGFGALATYELLGNFGLFRGTNIVWLSKLVEPFGVVNLVQYVVLIVAVLILANWTWYYLLKRLQTQLFMLALTGVVGLSLLITGLFVTLLLKSVETESLSKLTSNAKVVASLLSEKQARLKSETRLFAQNLPSTERNELGEPVKKQMLETGVSSLVIADSEGKIILKGENEEELGVSWSEDKYVIGALKGEIVSGVVSNAGVIAPEVSIRVAMKAGEAVVVASQILDSAYVDGLKNTTGLSVSIYGDQLMSATTEDVGDAKKRLIGIKETNKDVIERVWKKGEILAQAGKIGDRDYLFAYIPLRDQNNEVSAAMQVSQPQVVALQTAGQAVQLTFALVILVMIVLSLPIYLVTQRLVAQWV